MDEFEFQRAADFVRQLGCENVPNFVVTNPLDLMLQQRRLMADCVMVEMKVGVHQTALWRRLNTEDLASRGMAEARCLQMTLIGCLIAFVVLLLRKGRFKIYSIHRRHKSTQWV